MGGARGVRMEVWCGKDGVAPLRYLCDVCCGLFEWCNFVSEMVGGGLGRCVGLRRCERGKRDPARGWNGVDGASKGERALGLPWGVGMYEGGDRGFVYRGREEQGMRKGSKGTRMGRTGGEREEMRGGEWKEEESRAGSVSARGGG